MTTARVFFNAVAILFMFPALSSAASLASQFVPLEGMPQPKVEICERLGQMSTSQVFQQCRKYRSPTLEQASENITECFNIELNRANETPAERRLLGWFQFCAEKTSGRDVTSTQIRQCFRNAYQFRNLQRRLKFDTCVNQFDRQQENETPLNPSTPPE